MDPTYVSSPDLMSWIMLYASNAWSASMILFLTLSTKRHSLSTSIIDEMTTHSASEKALIIYKLGEKERAKIRNQKCGFIYQTFNLINELSVINNIRLPFDIAGKPYDTKRERELLAILDLEKRKHFYPSQLSGGERQRTAVARALLMQPSIILADEPTGNLDLESGNKLMAFVKRTNEEQGQTYVIVTHDLEWLKIAHKVYRMSDGKLVREVQQ